MVAFTFKLIPFHLTHRYTSVSICGTVYRSEKCWLSLNSTSNPINPNLPTFGKLKHILSLQRAGDHVIFVCDVVRAVEFDPHFGAYVLEMESDEVYPEICFYASSLKCHYLFSTFKLNDVLYIKSKYDLSGYML